jgi:thymidylate kinase
MADEYGFACIDATRPVKKVFEDLRSAIRERIIA